MEIENLLDKWYSIKENLLQLEKDSKKIRTKIEKYMDEKSVNKIEKGDYILKRKLQSRTTIDSSKLPLDIKKKYSKVTDFYTYSLSIRK